MNLHDDHDLESKVLVRDVLKSCWWMLLVFIVATSVDLVTRTGDIADKQAYLLQIILLPSLEVAAVLGLMEFGSRKIKKYAEYLLILGTHAITVIIITALYQMPMSVYLLVLPVLISLFFYRRKLILFSLALALLGLAVVLLFSGFRSVLGYSDLNMLIALMITTALIVSSLMNRALSTARHLVKTVQEKQELQTKNAIMEKLNRIDPATELYNHRSFHEYVDNLLNLSKETPLTIHLALLDIDNFKKVNDTYGHRTGDLIISHVAEQIREDLEPDDFASRYGGEEFAIVCVDKEQVRFMEQLEAIREHIARGAHPELDGERVTVSIGAHTYQTGTGKEELFRNADKALYQAKRSGKNRTVLLD